MTTSTARKPTACLFARSLRRGSRRCGFTFLELVVAMIVFSIAVAGLFPLLVIMSRQLQPLRQQAADGSVTYDCRTPARDGTSEGTGLIYVQHTWYLTPFDQPWARKLGAGVRMASNDTAFNSASTVATTLPVLDRDDDDDTTDSDADGTEDYTQAATPQPGNPETDNWTLGSSGSTVPGRDDYRYYPSLPTGQTPGYAYWNFRVSTAGWYSIQATWPTNIGVTLATDAQFGVAVNGGAPVTVAFDQHVAPSDDRDEAGTWWARLAEPVYLAANTLVTISLHANPDQLTYVVADGVRLVGVRNEVRVDSPVARSTATINDNSNHEDVTVRTTVTVNLPQVP